MKTFVQFSLMLSVAVTLGAAQETVTDKINKCNAEEYYDLSTGCPNYPKRIKCIEDIDGADDYENTILQDAINYEVAQRDACKGLKADCYISEAYHCTNDFESKRFHKEKEVCDEVKVARDCLIKLNNSCTIDVISYDIVRVDEVSVLCANGHYGDGPCDAGRIRDCNVDLFSTFRYDANGNTLGYKCEPQELSKAKTCMNALKEKCNSADLNKEIEEELTYIKHNCP